MGSRTRLITHSAPSPSLALRDDSEVVANRHSHATPYEPRSRAYTRLLRFLIARRAHIHQPSSLACGMVGTLNEPLIDRASHKGSEAWDMRGTTYTPLICTAAVVIKWGLGGRSSSVPPLEPPTIPAHRTNVAPLIWVTSRKQSAPDLRVYASRLVSRPSLFMWSAPHLTGTLRTGRNHEQGRSRWPLPVKALLPPMQRHVESRNPPSLSQDAGRREEYELASIYKHLPSCRSSLTRDIRPTHALSTSTLDELPPKAKDSIQHRTTHENASGTSTRVSRVSSATRSSSSLRGLGLARSAGVGAPPPLRLNVRLRFVTGTVRQFSGLWVSDQRCGTERPLATSETGFLKTFGMEEYLRFLGVCDVEQDGLCRSRRKGAFEDARLRRSHLVRPLTLENVAKAKAVRASAPNVRGSSIAILGGSVPHVHMNTFVIATRTLEIVDKQAEAAISPYASARASIFDFPV
ncbi:hypothetical protein BDW22DRAFT_1343349 [Trametopsis cervina]|nr:hypothetical protein BDW22DRAFT_1343349 [Trametopsis cervina]